MNFITSNQEEMTNSGKVTDFFQPKYYWLSKSIEDRTEIKQSVLKISPNLKYTKDFGGADTLHVGLEEDIKKYYDKHYYFISTIYLQELLSKGCKNFYLSDFSRQRVSFSFHNIRFNLFKLEEELEFDVVQEIKLMSGIPIKSSDISACDIIIAENLMCLSLMDAVNEGKIILSPDYVRSSYERKVRLNYDEFKLLPFSGIVFTSSDICSTTRKKLKEVISENGGVYQDNLDGRVDFLLIEKFSFTEKVKAALENKNAILSYRFVFDRSRRFCDYMEYVINVWDANRPYIRFFSNILFHVNDEVPEKPHVETIIEAYGGKLSRTSPTYIVTTNFDKRSPKAVTVNWICACVSEKKLVELNLRHIYRPFNYDTYTNDLKGVVVSLCLSNRVDRAVNSDILRAFGAIVIYHYRKGSKYVICDSLDNDLREKLIGTDSKVYKIGWVERLAKTGQIPTNMRELKEFDLDQEVDSLTAALYRKSYRDPMPSINVDFLAPIGSMHESPEILMEMISETKDD